MPPLPAMRRPTCSPTFQVSSSSPLLRPRLPMQAPVASTSMGSLWVRVLSPTCKQELAALQVLHGACLPITYEDAFFTSLSEASERLDAGIVGPPELHLPDAEDLDVVALVALSSALVPCPEHSDGTEPALKMVGFVTLRVEPLPWWPVRAWRWLTTGAAMNPGPTAYIMTLGVAEEMRGRGIGRVLLEAACHYAGVLRQCEAIGLHALTTNEAALAMYSSHGFRRIAELPGHFEFNGGRHDAFQLERRPIVSGPVAVSVPDASGAPVSTYLSLSAVEEGKHATPAPAASSVVPAATAVWSALFHSTPEGPAARYHLHSHSEAVAPGPVEGDIAVYLPRSHSTVTSACA